jgi:hypothetical protein
MSEMTYSQAKAAAELAKAERAAAWAAYNAAEAELFRITKMRTFKDVAMWLQCEPEGHGAHSITMELPAGRGPLTVVVSEEFYTAWHEYPVAEARWLKAAKADVAARNVADHLWCKENGYC